MLSLTNNNLSFTFRWLPSLVLLLACAVLVKLGFWQLSRADEKQQILSQYQQRMVAYPLQITALSEKLNPPDLQYRTLNLIGVMDNAKQFLLDNQIQRRQVGYDVLTPVAVAGSNKLVLVDRGFIPQGASRQQLPKIQAVSGAVNLHGYIYFPSSKVVVLNDRQENPGQWPLVIQKIDLNKVAKLLQQSVYPFVLRLEPKSKHGFLRVWPAITTKPAKHLAYAWQWFGLAFVCFIFVVLANVERKHGNC